MSCTRSISPILEFPRHSWTEVLSSADAPQDRPCDYYSLLPDGKRTPKGLAAAHRVVSEWQPDKVASLRPLDLSYNLQLPYELTFDGDEIPYYLSVPTKPENEAARQTSLHAAECSKWLYENGAATAKVRRIDLRTGAFISDYLFGRTPTHEEFRNGRLRKALLESMASVHLCDFEGMPEPSGELGWALSVDVAHTVEKNTGFFATRAQQHDLLQLDAVLTRSLSRLSYTPRTILGNVNQSELVCVDAALDQPEEASLFHYGCGMLRIGDPMFDLAYSMVFSDVCFSQASIWINTYEAIRREFLCQPNNLQRLQLRMAKMYLTGGSFFPNFVHASHGVYTTLSCWKIHCRCFKMSFQKPSKALVLLKAEPLASEPMQRLRLLH